jgi:MoaA/NifB/PqqE/SkfB family radical SAM enzyme
MRYDILKILDTLRQILSLSVIDVLQIQGGEAFLYPNLAGLLEFVLENKAVKRVVIATNGTLMPNVGLDLLRNPKLSVRISAYEHLSRKSAELKQYLDSNNVTNNMYSFASGIGRVWKLKM